MDKQASGIGIGPLNVVLQTNFEMVTSGKNYSGAQRFDQMKISGKCPHIFILQMPGCYSILYSNKQAEIDSYYEQSLYQDIEEEKSPLFIEIQKQGDESPFDEYKPFQIQYNFYFNSKLSISKFNIQQEIPKIESQSLQKCQKCQIEYQSQLVKKLGCSHIVCQPCFEDSVNYLESQENLMSEITQKKSTTCPICFYSLTAQELQEMIGKEKFDEMQRNT